jgi:hypothetical protein
MRTGTRHPTLKNFVLHSDVEDAEQQFRKVDEF